MSAFGGKFKSTLFKEPRASSQTFARSEYHKMVIYLFDKYLADRKLFLPGSTPEVAATITATRRIVKIGLIF